VVAGSDVSVTLPTDNTTFTGTATDDELPAGRVLTYSWTLVGGPPGPDNSPGAILSSPNTAVTDARFVGGPGEYTFSFTASDGELTGESTLRVTLQANTNPYPAPGIAGWTASTPAAEGMNAALLDQARDYSTSRSTLDTEAGVVIRNGRLVYSWGDAATVFEMKSTTKSMGGLALLLALDEDKVALGDLVSDRLPVFGTDPFVDATPVTDGSLNETTVLHLATHTSGLSKPDRDTAPGSPNNLFLNFKPGTTWTYSDQGLNWLADTLTQSYAADLNTLLFDKVFTGIGILDTDLTWRTNQYRSLDLNVDGVLVRRRELASGIDANVNAMARVGLLMLRKGVWGDTSILSNAVVEQAHTPPPEVASATIADPANFPGATSNYGVLWWTNATGQMPGVPTDAYWAWGLNETFIIVVPSLDLVIARAGDRSWHTDGIDWNADYDILAPFLTPIVQSVTP